MHRPKLISKPLVSIITPVYNAARFLPRLFECVKNQHGVTFEHILVDDCSTDDSLQVMKELAFNNVSIKIIAKSKNSGPVVARNLAIREASGKYVAFLDADDFWLPDKLRVQTEFMEKNGAALSFHDYRFISEDGKIVGRRLSGANRVGWSMHHVTRYLGCLTIMLNREKCPDFMFPNIEPEYRAEDFFAWSGVILQNGPALRCPHDLARYSVVAGSRSSSAFIAAMSVWKLYRKIEKIHFFESLIYFSVYIILTAVKRWWLKPRWESVTYEKALARSYVLRASND